jgi:isopentenyl-diphosphate Delta-isomerase
MTMSDTQALLIPAIAPDGALYPIEKMAAHRSGTLHLAVSIFVFCGDDLLIQKRALSKYHCGGTWANTCCTHPHWGESLDDSAHRRLCEEMGFDLALTPANCIDYRADVTNDLIEHERVQVYVAHINRVDVEIALNEHEVCDFAWANIEHLKEDAVTNPSLYAPWFRIYLARWDELGFEPTTF